MSIPQQANIPLEFNPPDFFYLNPSSGYNPTQCMAFSVSQSSPGYSPPSCNDTSGSSDYRSCYQYQLCQNKVLADQLYAKRDMHLTAQKKYADYQQQLTFSYITTANLGIGIIGGLAYIYYNK
jgi:hypothetical protein